jgi:ADP-ribose pyrophosphatase
MFKRQKYSETIFLPKKIKQRGVVYRDKFKKIVKVIAEFDKFKKIFFVTDYGPKAAVIININGKILLSRQYRLLLNNISYEIPAGSINKNEKPNKAAIRECLEETGYFCKKLKLLIEYDPDLECSKNHTYIFHTSYASKIKNFNRDKYAWVTIKNCLKMIKEGKIKDSLTIISILSKKHLN